jgi:hypothetical protein
MKTPKSSNLMRRAMCAPLLFMIIAALCVTQPTKALTEVLGFAGPGTQNCSEVNRTAIPGTSLPHRHASRMVA